MSTTEMNMPTYLVDEEGHKHYLKKMLGKGGQGAVYQTNDENVVIKVVLNNDGEIDRDERRYSYYKDQIDDVRILDIPQGVNVAKPILMLKKPYSGYVMRLLSGMVPIRNLMFTGSVQDPLKHYMETGGLRRRLQLLSKLARMFAQLQANSIVYGDISENNFFISRDVRENEAWLIDADNMRYTIDFNKVVSTLGYVAPEIAKGQSGNTTYSDVYSFAILALKILAFVGPFEGNLLFGKSESDFDDWEEDETQDVEEQDDWEFDGDQSAEKSNALKAEHGELPWIEDEDDDSNRSDLGIKREYVLSKNLKALFQRTFGKEGREDPTKRPTMDEWYDVLQRASMATIICHNCKTTYYMNFETCPFCNSGVKRPLFIQVRMLDVFDVNSMLEEAGMEDFEKVDYESVEGTKRRIKNIGSFALDYIRGKFHLTNLQTHDVFLQQKVEPTVEIELGTPFFIKNLSDTAIVVNNNKGNKTLKRYEIVEISTVDNVSILVPLTKYKSRQIYFKLRD